MRRERKSTNDAKTEGTRPKEQHGKLRRDKTEKGAGQEGVQAKRGGEKRKRKIGQNYHPIPLTRSPVKPEEPLTPSGAHLRTARAFSP